MKEKKNPFDKKQKFDTTNSDENKELDKSEETTENECSKTTEQFKVEEENNSDTQVVELSKKLEELNNQYVRLAADFDNYRKRQAQERESLLKYGAENTLKSLLVVLDTFDRAKKGLEEVNDSEKCKESIEVLHKQFLDALDKLGVKIIETENQKFDPNLHEAVMQTPNNDVEDNTILQELQKGYILNDKVLRPALVNVAINN